MGYWMRYWEWFYKVLLLVQMEFSSATLQVVFVKVLLSQAFWGKRLTWDPVLRLDRGRPSFTWVLANPRLFHRLGFLNRTLITFLMEQFFIVQDYPSDCRMFSIPGPWVLNDRAPLRSLWQLKTPSTISKCPQGGGECCPWLNHWCRHC